MEEPSADLYLFQDISEAISALVNIPIGMTFHTIYIYLYALVIMTVPKYIAYYHCENQMLLGKISSSVRQH